MGSPAFAVPTLDALIGAGHQVKAVYCQPPRPAGRGHRLEASAVESRARTLGLEVRTPRSLKPADEAEAFRALALDAAVVVAYGLILPRAILDAPRLGCLNAHASLLPRWRGAAPIERAIMAGDEATGVTIMRMEEGLDTGPMLLTRRVPIAADLTGGRLRDELAVLSAALMVEALQGFASGSIMATPQESGLACYAPKLSAADERLDWTRSAATLERAVRALAPRPGAHFIWQGERIKVFEATVCAPAEVEGSPGIVIDDRLLVACGEGSALRPTLLQRPGRKALPLEEFLRGTKIARGTTLA